MPGYYGNTFRNCEQLILKHCPRLLKNRGEKNITSTSTSLITHIDFDTLPIEQKDVFEIVSGVYGVSLESLLVVSLYSNKRFSKMEREAAKMLCFTFKHLGMDTLNICDVLYRSEDSVRRHIREIRIAMAVDGEVVDRFNSIKDEIDQ